MIKAVLLDLDNTLLHNPDRQFATQFLSLLDDYMRAACGIEQASQFFLQGLRRLASRGLDDIETGNQSLLVQLISNGSGRDAGEVQQAFDAFYTECYPELQACISPVEGAAELVLELHRLGYTLVITTNPLYPEVAVRERMRWAGLPDQQDLYHLVTGSDLMRFAKPHPAYYAEVLARVGIEPDEAVVVGDSLKNDILPSHTVGLHTFHVTTQPTVESSASGSLQDLYHLIHKNNWLEALLPSPLKPEMIEPQYYGNLGALFGMLSEVKPGFWAQHPDPDEWSILQILCHLLESEGTVQRQRLERILSEQEPFLVASPSPPGAEMPLCDDDGMRIAQHFVQERRITLDLLHRLGPDDWQRRARHSIFGLTTLLEMAYFTAQHDRLHLNQLCQTMGKCAE